MGNNNVKGTYIPSIEAEEIYNMSVRGLENIMSYEMIGQIPYSLELIKLRLYKHLFAEKVVGDKNQSDAVINIKFKNKLKKDKVIKSSVRGYESLMKGLVYQLDNLNQSIDNNIKAIKESNNKREQAKLTKLTNYLKNRKSLVSGHIERIQADKDNPIYHEVKSDELRNHIYTQGVTFKGRKYKFYKRTASKSRQSQCLMIREELYDRMKKWSHMGMDMTGELDVAAVLAYESLVSSSTIDQIEINPDNIFIIDDEFAELNNVDAIEVGDDLKPVHNDNATLVNNIWDGQALIDKSLMDSIGQGDKGMAQLRQAWFKCASFNTNIQLFLKNSCPADINYDEWKLKDMFGNWVNANQILLITTPSSLKFLKMAKGKEKEAYNNWKKHVKKEKLLGVCQFESPSKYGDHSYTSYQMINTLDANKQDVKALSAYEVAYVGQLQGVEDEDGNFNEQPFIDYLKDKADISNAYDMLVDIYNINPEVVRTKMFRDYRKKQISNYRTKIKGGKLRQEAEYCTVVGSPYEMLLATIGELKNDDGSFESHTLQGYQIYTKLYETGEYTAVRNPHNSASNFFKVENKFKMDKLDAYFNFSPQIAAINTISSNIQSKMNGMDQDGDTILIFGDKVFNSVVDKTLSNRDYPVIVNKIEAESDPVELTNENIAATDGKTAESQMWIGEVTNAAQYQVSVLHDIEAKEKYRQDKIDEILNNIAVLVVLSNVAIDYSKKVVDVDIDDALRDIRKSKAAKIEDISLTKTGKIKIKYKNRKKPRFWKYVSTSDVEMEDFNCPMDLLIDEINDIGKANYRKNLSFGSLLVDMSGELRGADNKQIGDILELVNGFNEDIKKINAEEDDKKDTERQSLIEDTYAKLDKRIGSKKIKDVTMYKILMMVSDRYDNKKGKTSDISSISVHLVNALYRNHKKTFLSLVK